MTSSLQCESVTASFRPPPTQNTAPIIEHRCLYTQDLRRKAKRWQDGLLRFHTFNKRVMVYDLPRNFIGDTHWREDYPIQDGDELELDRPILIQVGEEIGSVDQDLTELLEKRPRKKAKLDHTPGLNSSSPPSGPPSSSGLGQGNVMASPLVPKSLNALLGTPKGRLGRATLPTKSPFELRVLNDVAERDVQPLARKQGIAWEACRPRSVAKNGALHGKPSDQAGSEESQGQDKVLDCRMPIILSRDTEQPHLRGPHTKNPRKKQCDTTATNLLRSTEVATPQINSTSHLHESFIETSLPTAQVEGDLQQQEGKLKSLGRKAKTRLNEPTTSRDSTLAIDCEPPNIINIFSDTDTSSARSDERPNTKIKLQMASRKPRRKLMYKDLLPPSAIATDETFRKRGDDYYDMDRRLKNAHFSQSNHETQTEGIRDAFKRTRRKTKAAPPTFINDQFCGGAEPIQRSDRPNGPPVQHNSGNLLAVDIVDRSKSPSSEMAETNIPKPISTIHDTNAVLAQMDEILFSQSQAPDSRKTKQRTPFQKSNSDMPVSTLGRPVSDLDKSDPGSGPISDAQEQIISPWSREAWDLFGCGRDGQAVDFAVFCAKEGV